jgi:hypothetical protein
MQVKQLNGARYWWCEKTQTAWAITGPVFSDEAKKHRQHLLEKGVKGLMAMLYLQQQYPLLIAESYFLA